MQEADVIFKVRDLLITVDPERLADDCGSCSNDTRCNGCTNQYSDCPGGCSNARSDFSENCPKWRFDPADLVELTDLMRYTLARSEVASLEAKMEANTAEHLDAVEARLRDALTDVREAAQAHDKDEKSAGPSGLRGGSFRVRDLMISVLPRGVADDASGCPACTCAAGCSSDASSCTNTSGHEFKDDWTEVLILPELRALLGQALASVGGPSARPEQRAAGDLRKAEAEIEGALETIARRRQG
jgi:hypothetical protein